MSGPVGGTVRTALCDLLGIEHPVVGFSPSEHVAAAVSRAGGLGVLGCVRFNDPAELDRVLDWMDRNTGGRPYGIDVVMPAQVPAEGGQQVLGCSGTVSSGPWLCSECGQPLLSHGVLPLLGRCHYCGMHLVHLPVAFPFFLPHPSDDDVSTRSTTRFR